MTGQQAADLLGVSRTTLYRWHHEGRLYCWEWETERARTITKRPRGPRRNPRSRRYTIGRHRFDEIRTYRRST